MPTNPNEILGRDGEPQPVLVAARGDKDPEGTDDRCAEPPDLAVLQLNRRPPPRLPLEVFNPPWRRWIEEAAAAAACPPDYVTAALLAAASAIIGNSRWAQAVPGWTEPPHLWCASVGDSGQGKSPGADMVLRHVVPSIEARLTQEFQVQLQEHRAQAETNSALIDAWDRDRLTAHGKGSSRSAPGQEAEPIAPRFLESDMTIEKVAAVLAGAAPKGLLMVRDELSGWLSGMNTYNSGARAFWVEAYGGRSYRVDRMKQSEPLIIPHLAVSWFGGIQPSKLERVMREADDGLLARFCWFWPDPLSFKLTTTTPDAGFAVAAFERLSMLALAPPKETGLPPSPICVPLCESARARLENFGQDMQAKQESNGGLLVSALGKARGLVLRLSMVIEHLWWAGQDGTSPAPAQISEAAFHSAATLVSDYLMPMAERVYGDAVATPQARNAATLARWIVKARPVEIYVRNLQRQVRLPGLGEAAQIHEACKVLVEAGWLRAPQPGTRDGRARAAYPICPELWKALG
jgi:Protein of unknown function (DUF3987)